MASPDFNIGPTGPVIPPSSSRALTRVTPVSPQRVNETPDSPLKRSGLDIRELFNAPDQVVVRSRTPAAALELGLEQARGSMVRNQPADALAALDEVWSGARHTESGWYIRGGSLALLGLPGEASRVIAEGLLANPESSANHFLQSLVNLTLGDVAAARLSLSNAVTNTEPDALLFIQHALVSAQSGNVAQAEEWLRRAATEWPDHPALAYGRSMMRDVLRNRMRDGDRTPNILRTPVSVAALFDDDASESSEPARVSEPARAAEATHVPEPADVPTPAGDGVATAREVNRDVAAEALGDLGKQLATGTRRQALTDARALLVSLSAGGTLATSMPAARAHATRVILGAILEAISTTATTPGLGWEAESIDGQWQRSTPAWSPNLAGNDTNIRGNEVLLNTVRLMLGALREGRPAEAEHQLRRAGGSIGETTTNLLRAILGTSDDSSGKASRSRATDEQSAVYIQNGEPGHALLAPLRLGLALLPESELSQHSPRVSVESDATVTYAASMGSVPNRTSGLDMREVAGSAGSMVAAIGLIAVAVVAFSMSFPLIAIACAGGGAWLALRRGERAP